MENKQMAVTGVDLIISAFEKVRDILQNPSLYNISVKDAMIGFSELVNFITSHDETTIKQLFSSYNVRYNTEQFIRERNMVDEDTILIDTGRSVVSVSRQCSYI